MNTALVRITRELIGYVTFDSINIYKVGKEKVTSASGTDVRTEFAKNDSIYDCTHSDAQWKCEVNSGQYSFEVTKRPFAEAFKDEVSLMFFGALQGEQVKCDQDLVCFASDLCSSASDIQEAPDIDVFLDGNVIVMRDKSKIVALCNFVHSSDATINALCVASMHRRKKVALTLFNYIIKEYRVENILVEILIDKTIELKRLFYKSLGFEYKGGGRKEEAVEVWVYRKTSNVAS